jgi:hypothetical protein
LTLKEKEKDTSWCEEELGGVKLGDKRLDMRLVEIASKLAAQPTASINQACEDWADAKAAYRLFDNAKVQAKKILSPHQERTRGRMKNHGLVLAVQDTTLLDYSQHPKTKGVGSIGTKKQDLSGFVMHATLALTPGGLPLGVLTKEIWVRSDEEDGLSKSERKKRPIEQKESYKWLKALQETVELTPAGVQVVSVCDREADIYEFLVEAKDLETDILVRAAQDRSLKDKEARKLWGSVTQATIAGYLKVQVPAKEGQSAREAIVAVRFRSVTLKPPQRPKSAGKAPLPPITVNAILVQEVNPPSGVTPLEWLLLTNLPVHSFDDAVERIRWYRCRWQIEIYFKVLKSGCKVEDCRLATANRLLRFLTLCCIIAWRLYWLTHISRILPEQPCTTVLTEHEWRALYATINRTTRIPSAVPSVRQAIRWIAQLGGFLGRKGDGEPGPTTIWRGWQRLNDISATWLLFHPPTRQETCG